MSPTAVFFLCFFAAWILCGAVSYAGTFAYFQREYPGLAEEGYWSDFGVALLIGAAGGIGGLLVVVFKSEFFRHGFKWW
jgi:hypothetical protein